MTGTKTASEGMRERRLECVWEKQYVKGPVCHVAYRVDFILQTRGRLKVEDVGS